MDLSRGARRCLELLQSYARSSGRAFPFQSTIAAKLGVGDRMVRKYIRELAQAGALQVRKRQHSSAEYVLRQEQKFRSEFRSEFRSGRRVLLVREDLVKLRKPPGVETQTQDTPEFWEGFEREMAEPILHRDGKRVVG